MSRCVLVFWDKDLVEIRTGLPQQWRQIQLGRMTFTIFEKHLTISQTVHDRVKYRNSYALDRIGPTLRSSWATSNYPKPHHYFSECKLTFTFAMLSPVRLPVVCLSVTLVTPYSGCRNFLSIFLRHLVRWPSADIQEKFYGDHPRGTPRRGTYTGSQIQRYWTYRRLCLRNGAR